MVQAGRGRQDDDRFDHAEGGDDAMSTDSPTVLMLSNDPADAQFVREALQDWEAPSDSPSGKCVDGVELRHATTLQDGIDEWNGDVDVIVTELELRDSTGLGTIDALTDVNTNESRYRDEGRSAPIVVLARPGVEGSAGAVEAIAHGAQEYVEKDRSDPNTLRRRIRCAIERYDAERSLRRRNRELADLVSVIGHDIRNDLAVIVGWSGVIEECADSIGRDGLDRIGNASQNVLRIVETATDLLDVLDNRRETELRSIAIVEVTRTEVERARTTFPAAEIELVKNVPEDETVEATELLSAVFRELIANGIRYNVNSTPMVTIELTDGATSVTIDVTDTGPEIPSDRREEVFGRGERGLESAEARLGLYFIDTVVSEYCGTIEVNDTGPDGTSIEVTLPKAKPTFEGR